MGAIYQGAENQLYNHVSEFLAELKLIQTSLTKLRLNP
jgi:hypothetical protein